MNFTKIIHPADLTDENRRPLPIFCNIKYINECLSITGVIGPTRDGNAKGGCGQIDTEFGHKNPAQNDKRITHPVPPERLAFAPGWSIDLWYTFLDIWHNWHLNDMRAGCVHQIAADWGKNELTIYHYDLETTIYTRQCRIKTDAITQLESTGAAILSPEDHAIFKLPLSITSDKATPPHHYKLTKKETKNEGWVTQEEHIGGKLSRPCPICNYKYGTAWLKTEVPQQIIAFLQSLPNTDTQPTWC